MFREIIVPLGPRSYRVLVSDRGDWDRMPLPEVAWSRSVLVTDARVGPLWSAPVIDWLRSRRVEVSEIRVPEGEASKDLSVLHDLYDSFLESALDRKACVVALGGGVVGDLAGFAAATYLRGVDLLQIPTSLLAMVDSSVGGKVGVNFRGTKNVVGAFHQPRLVLTSPEFLGTLPDEHLANGMAEAIKAGLIGDPELFALLEREPSRIWSRDPDVLREVVARSVAVKAGIVADDEREAGRRRLLNLGHTIGHALEAASGFALRHGEAVAIGIVAACQLSILLGVSGASHRDRIERLLASHRLPTRIRGFDWDAIEPFLRRDKKIRDGEWTFVLTGDVGDVTVRQRVSQMSVREAVDYVLG